MKLCSDCSQEAPLSESICSDCGSILEEGTYFKLICISYGISALTTLALKRIGYVGYGFVVETLISGTFFLILGTLAWKVSQKIKQPPRLLLRELASLYSDRDGRATLLVAVVVVVLIHFGIIELPASKKPGATGATNFLEPIRSGVILFGGVFYLLISIVQMKLRFFDFRIKNPLAPPVTSGN